MATPLCVTHDEAFTIYKAMTDRSQEALRREIGRRFPKGKIPSSATVSKWSQRHDWHRRLAKHDAEVANKTADKLVENIADLRARLATEFHHLSTHLIERATLALDQLIEGKQITTVHEYRELVSTAIELAGEIRMLTMDPNAASAAPAPEDTGDPLAAYHAQFMAGGTAIN